MKAIGIDIGTTSVCGVLINVESGKLLASQTKNHSAFLPGCAEWKKIQSVDTIPIGHKHKEQTLRSNKTVTSKYNG